MKKILLAFALIPAFSGVFAQSFSLSTKNSNVEGPNAGYKDAIVTVTNTASDNTDTLFRWTILEINTPSSWGLSFCDPKDCYIGFNIGKSEVFTLKNTNSGPLKATFEFKNNSGNGCVKLYLESVKTGYGDTVNFCGTAWMTGLNDVNAIKAVTCYPNPVKDQLTVQFNSREVVNVEIYNVLGSKVKSFSMDSGKTTISIADLDKGVYFIRLRDKNSLYTRSFTKSDN